MREFVVYTDLPVGEAVFTGLVFPPGGGETEVGVVSWLLCVGVGDLCGGVATSLSSGVALGKWFSLPSTPVNESSVRV